MDGVRFEPLARSLGARATRRIALGILPVLGLGNALGDTAAKKKKKKSKRCPAKKKKCNRKCIPKNDCCQDANCPEGYVCNRGTCCLPNCIVDGSPKHCGSDGCGGLCGPCQGECNPDGQCLCPGKSVCAGGVCCPKDQICLASDACGACPVGTDNCNQFVCGATESGKQCFCASTTDGSTCFAKFVCAVCQTAQDCAAVLDRPAAAVACLRDTACGNCPATENSGCVVKGCQDA